MRPEKSRYPADQHIIAAKNAVINPDNIGRWRVRKLGVIGIAVYLLPDLTIGESDIEDAMCIEPIAGHARHDVVRGWQRPGRHSLHPKIAFRRSGGRLRRR